MELVNKQYYHLYNRSNGKELLFRSHKNYIFFLKNFRERFESKLNVIAYCLMPTHFHFFILVNTFETNNLKKQIGVHLSSYTKAYNKQYSRNGSLFQQHTKAKHVDDDEYLLTLLTYIHQNPVRAELVKNLEDWPYSSYPDLAGIRNGTLVENSIAANYFANNQEFINFSNHIIDKVIGKYWIK